MIKRTLLRAIGNTTYVGLPLQVAIFFFLIYTYTKFSPLGILIPLLWKSIWILKVKILTIDNLHKQIFCLVNWCVGGMKSLLIICYFVTPTLMIYDP